MNAKDFLRKVRDQQREILELQQSLEYMRMSVLPGGIRYDKDRVQSSPEDKTSELLSQAADIEHEINEGITRLLQDSHKAMNMIDGLSKPKYREVMRAYYLPIGPLPTWDEVASRLNYSTIRVLQLHGEALKELKDYSKL